MISIASNLFQLGMKHSQLTDTGDSCKVIHVDAKVNRQKKKLTTYSKFTMISIQHESSLTSVKHSFIPHEGN